MLQPAGVCCCRICPVDGFQQGNWLPGARLFRHGKAALCQARRDARRVRFVRPELVAEVEFRAWTTDGLIRHASFRGLREDKRAEEVVLEMNHEGVAPEYAFVRDAK
jgi:hypothetical protein